MAATTDTAAAGVAAIDACTLVNYANLLSPGVLSTVLRTLWIGTLTAVFSVIIIVVPLVMPSMQGAFFLLFMAFFRERSPSRS